MTVRHFWARQKKPRLKVSTVLLCLLCLLPHLAMWKKRHGPVSPLGDKTATDIQLFGNGRHIKGLINVQNGFQTTLKTIGNAVIAT
jgi:hypothetical protein